MRALDLRALGVCTIVSRVHAYDQVAVDGRIGCDRVANDDAHVDAVVPGGRGTVVRPLPSRCSPRLTVAGIACR